MANKFRIPRPSAAMIVACLALFVALGGGSYAAFKLKPNSVKAKNLKTAAVTEPKIATGAVTESKLGTNAVTSAKIADNAVTTGKIADAAVTTAKLADASVTKAKFAASGTATNTGTYTLTPGASPVCTLDTTFAAPGVQPGDVIAFSLRDAPALGGVVTAMPGEDEAATNLIKIEICANAAPAAVTPGTLKIDWIAIR